jgi:hypothetical protein
MSGWSPNGLDASQVFNRSPNDRREALKKLADHAEGTGDGYERLAVPKHRQMKAIGLSRP